MTLAQKLRAYIDRLADLSAADLTTTLGPMLTEGEIARLWLAERLADIAEDPPLLPAGFADPVCQSLVILDHGRVNLSLAVIGAARWNARRAGGAEDRDIVGFADGWTTIRFLHAGCARIQRHILSPTTKGWRSFSETPEEVTNGQSIRMDNAVEALRFVEVGADVVMLRLLVRDPDVEQAIECDARTGEVLRVREAQARHGQTRMTVSLLRSLGRRDAVPVIARSLASWPAHLRWHGVREALATDSLTGFDLLQDIAASDPDPALRALARRTRDALAEQYPQLAGLDAPAWR